MGWLALNAASHDRFGDPEIQARIAQYEMAFRMQAAAPELCDTSERTGAHLRALRRRLPDPGHLRRQLPARPAPRRVRASVSSSSSTAAGTSTDNLKVTSRVSVRHIDQASARWSPISSSVACSTTPSSSGAASSAAPSTSKAPIPDSGPRPPRPLFQHPGWPAAESRAASSTAETDDYCYNILEEPGAHPRPQRHHPAEPRHQPRTPDLQLPGARPETDWRRARPRDQGPHRLRQVACRWRRRHRFAAGS